MEICILYNWVCKKNENGIITGELGIEALLNSALKGVDGEITYQKIEMVIR